MYGNVAPVDRALSTPSLGSGQRDTNEQSAGGCLAAAIQSPYRRHSLNGTVAVALTTDDCFHTLNADPYTPGSVSLIGRTCPIFSCVFRMRVAVLRETCPRIAVLERTKSAGIAASRLACAVCDNVALICNIKRVQVSSGRSSEWCCLWLWHRPSSSRPPDQ